MGGNYRLLQTVSYWPQSTVFVSVVDPGVGSNRSSVVVKTSMNQYIITPDNGTLTHIKRIMGIVEARIIDESQNRLPKSGESHTFHGRDIFAFTGARLASNVISFEQIGPRIPVESICELPLFDAFIKDGCVAGMIDILDVRFGNVWTNIDRSLFKRLGIQYGSLAEVRIEHINQVIYENMILFGRSFADSRIGEPILYVNSLDKMGIAINQGSFAKEHGIITGCDWRIFITKGDKMIE